IIMMADGLLFLSLLSGRNPDYLIGQHLRSVPKLKNSGLEIIPTAYLLIDGGRESAVAKVTQTRPMSQEGVEEIVHTAMAGQFQGAQLIYLEAGSGALHPVGSKIISEVKKHTQIPLIVGGGIRSQAQQEAAYQAGADMVVMGTAFESTS
ncbi:MAG: geranylgeranylglyceryl phosphate synthase family protein, partial [Flavobacteriaceae bacterium]|nr:geranylgeranylglyceryl phosphate synthase family protein [Flavobacteriaceae bacterium]